MAILVHPPTRYSHIRKTRQIRSQPLVFHQMGPNKLSIETIDEPPVIPRNLSSHILFVLTARRSALTIGHPCLCFARRLSEPQTYLK